MDGVTYMSGVYKIPMVRMFLKGTGEPANVRVYRADCIEMCRSKKLRSVWSSKNTCYEKPCCVTGASKLTGLKQAPKDICTDRSVGTRKGIEFHLEIDRRRIISCRIDAEKQRSHR